MSLRTYSNLSGISALGNPGGISAGATTMYLVSGGTAGYPVSFPFTLWLAPNTPTPELVEVTSGAGTSGSPWNINRGIDGTTAQAHGPGTVVEHAVSARDLSEPNTHLNSGNVGAPNNPHALGDDAWQVTSLTNAALATANTNMAKLVLGINSTTAPYVGAARNASTQPMYMIGGTVTTSVTNTAGGFSFNYGNTFNGYSSVVVTAGDNPNSMGFVTLIQGNCTVSACGGIAQQRGSTSVVPNGTAIRLNYVVIGW